MNGLKIVLFCFLCLCFAENVTAEGLPANPWAADTSLRRGYVRSSENPFSNPTPQIQELDLHTYDRQLEYNAEQIRRIKKTKTRVAAEEKQRREQAAKQQQEAASENNSFKDMLSVFSNTPQTTEPQTNQQPETDWFGKSEIPSGEDMSATIQKKFFDGLNDITGINVRDLWNNTLNLLQ